MANDFDESSANEEASKGLSWWYSADVLSRDKSDKTAKRIRRISITDRLLRHPGRLSMVYFGALIIIVTGLLLLPISTSASSSPISRSRSSPPSRPCPPAAFRW